MTKFWESMHTHRSEKGGFYLHRRVVKGISKGPKAEVVPLMPPIQLVQVLGQILSGWPIRFAALR